VCVCLVCLVCVCVCVCVWKRKRELPSGARYSGVPQNVCVVSSLGISLESPKSVITM
jgi:hypothetical protein